VFNPYSDCCPEHDRPDADSVRRRNLLRCLEFAIEARVDTIWIARDLGYRGGRRTGVPLTDEVNLPVAASLMGQICLDRATHGPAVAERTAAVVWNILSQIGAPVFLWNVFPLHPHELTETFSNRCHTKGEREATWPLLLALIKLLEPRRIVAIGRDAAIALNGLDVHLETVRHPSYGGQAEFLSGLSRIYGVAHASSDTKESKLPLFCS
jgi:hypothetical protein